MLKESKLIEELKRKYDEKLKKLRQKEKEKENKDRIYKKLSSALFKDFEINEDFKNEFNLLVEKFDCKNTKNILDKINNLYDFNHRNDKIDIAESLLKKDFSNQYIKFDIITDKEKIPLNIILGDKNFEKGIEHLINIGSSKISKENINHKIKKDINNRLGIYKPKIYDEMLDGTFKALQNLSEIANKDIGVMISEFANSYSETREKFEKSKLIKVHFLKK